MTADRLASIREVIEVIGDIRREEKSLWFECQVREDLRFLRAVYRNVDRYILGAVIRQGCKESPRSYLRRLAGLDEGVSVCL
jgi:hypothetical protein